MPGGTKKTKVGTVVSDKMDKTVVVRIDRTTKHPVYKKYIKRSKKVKAHDADNTCRQGDQVKILEVSRPLSRDKRWIIMEVMNSQVTKAAAAKKS